MSMIGGLACTVGHTYGWVDGCSGEAGRGQVAPAHRLAFREWLAGLPCAEGDFRGGRQRWALCGRLARAHRLCGACGRDRGPARVQAARQDRPGRRQAQA
jgi:hypothetical protein